MKNKCPLLEASQRESKAVPVIRCQGCASIGFLVCLSHLSSDPMQRLGCQGAATSQLSVIIARLLHKSACVSLCVWCHWERKTAGETSVYLMSLKGLLTSFPSLAALARDGVCAEDQDQDKDSAGCLLNMALWTSCRSLFWPAAVMGSAAVLRLAKCAVLIRAIAAACKNVAFQ